MLLLRHTRNASIPTWKISTFSWEMARIARKSLTFVRNIGWVKSKEKIDSRVIVIRTGLPSCHFAGNLHFPSRKNLFHFRTWQRLVSLETPLTPFPFVSNVKLRSAMAPICLTADCAKFSCLVHSACRANARSEPSLFLTSSNQLLSKLFRFPFTSIEILLKLFTVVSLGLRRIWT